MELQDDGNYNQIDYIVGRCENCDYPLVDVDFVEQMVKNGETWDGYECSKCGHLTLI